MKLYNKSYLKAELLNNLSKQHTDPNNASNQQFYKAVGRVINHILENRRRQFRSMNIAEDRKQISYLSMEFLMGRSLKNHLSNLSLTQSMQEVLDEYEVKLEDIYQCEPDAGLGNGGLGRLAACYLDGLATLGYNSFGYSILYEFGIFNQKIVDGWQTELPDNWLPGGRVWLNAQPELAVEVQFGGKVDEFWDHDGYHYNRYTNYSIIRAIPYDLYVSGYDSKAVAVLRLWKAESPDFDMELFNEGNYSGALEKRTMAEAISKVLYPNDNHPQGKALRLRQQYFLCAASIADISSRHIRSYGTMETFAEKNAIHINDTHPTLAIPELMRILLDDCGYNWEKAWKIVSDTFTYTNHTVMNEALEIWDEDLFRSILPRIHQIVKEINRRFVEELKQSSFGWDHERIHRMAVLHDHKVRMANLCVYTCHKINGVSALHSDIIREALFHDFYEIHPERFTNVTNGIAYRRWLLQANPGLSSLLSQTIGDTFQKDASALKAFAQFADDPSVQERLFQTRQVAKERLAQYIYKIARLRMNVNSIFDVQVKRLHEYKRQHLNALNIICDYLTLKNNPNAAFTPKTYIFGAKAAPGYYMAKQIIKLICSLANEIRKDPVISEKLSVIYLENYSVTLSEKIMPASDISEQISLAGTEASGTGNMKFMLNGAVTLGTEDGANVEIHKEVGDDNILIFGMTADQAAQLKKDGYVPIKYYNNNPEIRQAIDLMEAGIDGNTFPDIVNSLKWSDPYMVLADFASYRQAQHRASELYMDRNRWMKMAIFNIAHAGYFSADRAVEEYAQTIWNLTDPNHPEQK